MGKASFAHLLDALGQIQFYVRRDDVGDEAYAEFKDYDVGDLLGITGVVFRTQKGEISIHTQTLTLLSKSLKVLPEKFHGLKDPDLRYRQRYVDMIVNPEVRDTFRKRSQIINAVRAFLDARGFLEVDTPVLQTVEIGASARTFKTHLNALDLDMLFHLPIKIGSIFVLGVVLVLQFSNSYRKIEKIIIGFVSLIGLSFLFEITLVQTDWAAAASGWVTPSFPDGAMLCRLFQSSRLRLLKARSISRCASRSAAASRLSCSCLPLHRPNSSFIRPSFR